jgi:thioredoxin reductase (NADPH)
MRLDDPKSKSIIPTPLSEPEPATCSVDVLIVGAGPAGLATAIAAGNAGLDYLVLEKGLLVNSIYHFPRHMVFFTTPELLEIGGLPLTTPNEKPTRMEALRYYRRVVDALDLKVRLGVGVRSIRGPSASGTGGLFKVETRSGAGTRQVYSSRFAVVATGYYDNPNMLGIRGEDLRHVSHYYTEPHPFYRKNVVVVGGNNSAAEAALDLYRTGARVTLVHRGRRLGASIKYWVKPDITNRIKEGSITAHFGARMVEIRRDSVLFADGGGQTEIPADAVFLLTGYHPDVDLLERAGVRIQERTLVPEHDPETLETNVAGLYLAGAIVSGKETNRVFIENGRFHGEAVIKDICKKGQLL